MKKSIELVFIFLFLFFLILFITKNNNYYENERVLTKEAIERFEDDIKNGREIVTSNYINEAKDYSNKASIIGLKCSNAIEKIINKLLGKFLRYIDNN